MPRTLVLVRFALAMLLALPCATARAEQGNGARPLRISLQPGVTCLTEPALTSALAEALAGAELPTGIEVDVVGSHHDPRGVTLRIHYPDGSEFVREFNPAPERCEHLHQTVALALALTLKATTGSSTTTSIPAGSSSSPRDTTRDSQASLPQVPGELAIGVGALVTPGLLGSFAGGGQLHVAYARRHLAVRAGALALRSSEQPMPRSGHYTAALYSARIDLCARLGKRERLSAELCAGPLAGVYHVQGVGLTRDNSTRLRFLGIAAGLDLVQPLGAHFALRGSAALLTTLQPVSVVARDRAGRIIDRKDFSRVGAALLLGIDYRFD